MVATEMLNLISGTTSPVPHDEHTPNTDYPMTFSNPTFWRDIPLLAFPIPKDIAASAGFWLLENSTDLSAVTAVVAVFPGFQWPSHYPSSTTLIRLRDVYVECFRAPESKKSAHSKALQSAAAYYVLYHTQLIRSTWKSLGGKVEKHPRDLGSPPRDLPRDLFLTDSPTDLEQAHRGVGKIPGADPHDHHRLHLLCRSGNRLPFASGGLDSNRQKVCATPLVR